MAIAGAGIIWGHFLWARYRLKCTERHDVLKFCVSIGPQLRAVVYRRRSGSSGLYSVSDFVFIFFFMY